MATTTILGVFEHQAAAQQALDELRASGLDLKDTSLVSQDGSGATGEGGTLSAPTGAVFGAAWGGLVGLAALAIPGVGPFIAGGAIAAALTGAAAGAAVGGIAGALIHSANVPEAAAKRYETMVHAGKTIVAVRADEADALAVRRILAHDGAESVRENQTDMLHRGAVNVAMYDEAGHEINAAPNDNNSVSIERTADTIGQSAMVVRGGGLVATRETTLDHQNTPADVLQNSATSGREDSFDTEDIDDDTGFENGARVVSFEEENRQASAPPMPKDVPPA